MRKLMEAYNIAAKGDDPYKHYAAVVTLRKEIQGFERTLEIYEKHIHANMFAQLEKDLLKGN